MRRENVMLGDYVFDEFGRPKALRIRIGSRGVDHAVEFVDKRRRVESHRATRVRDRTAAATAVIDLKIFKYPRRRGRLQSDLANCLVEECLHVCIPPNYLEARASVAHEL